MTGDDSMSDDVFEVEAVSSSLTPGTTGQPVTTTPSPTGYRDYKPPAEVFTENYGYTSRDYDNMSSLKRTKEDDSAFAHKITVFEVAGQLGNFDLPEPQIRFELLDCSEESNQRLRSARIGSVIRTEYILDSLFPTGKIDGRCLVTLVSRVLFDTLVFVGLAEVYGQYARKLDDRDMRGLRKTILLGDSGVGKTSLLVQFDTGKFQPRNFAATVGIGFTVFKSQDSRLKIQVSRFKTQDASLKIQDSRFKSQDLRLARFSRIELALCTSKKARMRLEQHSGLVSNPPRKPQPRPRSSNVALELEVLATTLSTLHRGKFEDLTA
ncbi:Ras-related protein Rab-26 [Habropoda laboriosa]|uniref:Ras-related protein Rab-26 n=1 Tax=Habropoda laboriosa TaxID=597456 RepID=A0A0L7R7I6_9HYME|nr:Ras-related protein Rab-26 [Habropoda laboriosa]